MSPSNPWLAPGPAPAELLLPGSGHAGLSWDTLKSPPPVEPLATVMEPSDTCAGPRGSGKRQRASSSPAGGWGESSGLPERAVLKPRPVFYNGHTK